MGLLSEAIREIPIFSGLSREDLDKVLAKMEECSFDAGSIIFSQGERADSFYFIELVPLKLSSKV
jgi:CRP-like cAMP-binding protein